MRLAACSALTCVGVIAALAPDVANGDTSCAAVQYVSTLQRVASDLAAETPDVGAEATALQQLVTQFPESKSTLTPAINDLRATPPDLQDAAMWVDAQAKALALPPGAVCGADTSSARNALNQVYASPVFANLDHNQPPSLLSQIGQWIASLFRSAGTLLGPAGSILLGSLLLLILLALAAWRLRRVLGDRTARVNEEPPGDSDDPNREWSMAERAAASGNHREAIRRAFRSALLEVVRRGRVPVDPAWTTRELLAATRADAALLAVLAPAADSFDRAWYSGHPVSTRDWEHGRTRCAAVRAAARSRAAINAP